MIAPIDPTAAVGAVQNEWAIPPLPDIPALDGAGAADAVAGATAGGEGFGSLLANEIAKLSDLQTRAAEAGQALATGTVDDPVSAIVAVEKAQLAMQFAAQIRTRTSEALAEIFRTQI